MMKRAIFVLVVVAFSGADVHADSAYSRLEAISLIESGDDDTAVGDVGEVSRYQIRPAVWRQYSGSRAYRNPAVSTQVAEQHLSMLVEFFRKRAQRDPTDFDCYVMWNGGPNYYARLGFSAQRVHRTIRERARRYVNLRQIPVVSSTPAVAPRTKPATGILALGGLAP